MGYFGHFYLDILVIMHILETFSWESKSLMDKHEGNGQFKNMRVNGHFKNIRGGKILLVEKEIFCGFVNIFVRL